LTKEQIKLYQKYKFINKKQVLDEATLQHYNNVITKKVNELNKIATPLEERDTANCQLQLQLPTAHCQLPTAHCQLQLPTAYCLLPTETAHSFSKTPYTSSESFCKDRIIPKISSEEKSFVLIFFSIERERSC